MDLKDLISGNSSLFNSIRRAPVGVSMEELHQMIVVELGTATEEEFFLAYQAAQVCLELDAAPSTGR